MVMVGKGDKDIMTNLYDQPDSSNPEITLAGLKETWLGLWRRKLHLGF